MILPYNHLLPTEGKVSNYSLTKEVTFTPLSGQETLLRVTTKHGYSVVVTTCNALKTKTGWSEPKIGEMLSIATPPKRKIAFSLHPYSLAILSALLSTRSSLEITNRIRYSMFILWLKSRFMTLPYSHANLQVLAWACGYHIKQKRNGVILSTSKRKYDKVVQIEVMHKVTVRRVSVRTTAAFYELNSFKFKLR